MQLRAVQAARGFGGLCRPARIACRAATPASRAVRCSSAAAGDSASSGGGEPAGDAAPQQQEQQQQQASDATYSSFKGFQPRPQQAQQKPTAADALQNTLAAASSAVGRTSTSNNVIMDTTADEGKWRELDQQVNEYPGQRTFKAIGSGDQDFVQAMTACVERVVGTVHAECVQQRLSAKGNYISVTVGPVWVETPEQVLQIYENMKADGRLRFFF